MLVTGLAGVAVMYLLGRKIARPGAGLIAAFLTAINWSHLLHSQDARPYSQLFLLAALSYLAFAHLVARPGLAAATGHAAATLLLVYTHYFGWLIWLAQAGTVALFAARTSAPERRGLLRAAVPSLLVVIIGYLPYVGRTMVSFTTRVYWVPRPEPDAFVDLFLYFFHDPALALLCAVLILALCLREYVHRADPESAQDARALWLIAAWAAVGYLVPYAHSVNANVSVMEPRYFMTLLPALILAAALAIDRAPGPTARAALIAAVGLLAALDIFSVGDYYRRPAPQEYRELVVRLPHEDDTLYFGRYRQTFKFEYYFRLQGSDARVHKAEPEMLREVLRDRLTGPEVPVWLIENIEIYGLVKNAAVLRFFADFMTREEEIERRCVRARRYVAKPDRWDALRNLLDDDAAWRAWLIAAPDE
ncbi:MAG TPA: hypothetical protein PKI11_08600 [Candidatus Hydrogenedentes bacterium]|nr:hypothetical protein [Candidatus Hydrogenedentota bacterium]